jgi:hypothetical protein
MRNTEFLSEDLKGRGSLEYHGVNGITLLNGC